MINMKDIAKEVGVSRTTVSFVLNGRYKQDVKISSDIVEKVLATAERLGYVRNELVQSVVSGKSSVIALLGSFADFTMPIIRGYADTAAEFGYSLKMIPWHNRETLREAIMTAIRYRVAGMAIFGLNSQQKKEVNDDFSRYHIPISGVGDQQFFSQEASAEVMADYLISLGHKKIACIQTESEISGQRVFGYRKALIKQGLTPHLFNGAADFQTVVDFQPDAVFCVHDPLALTLCQFLFRRKLFVPEIFSVAGFGGIQAAELSSPSLTTVEEPFYETGSLGFRNLHHIIETGRPLQTDAPLVAKLRIRESTTPYQKKGI